jgi:hypothetical protein
MTLCAALKEAAWLARLHAGRMAVTICRDPRGEIVVVVHDPFDRAVAPAKETHHEQS